MASQFVIEVWNTDFEFEEPLTEKHTLPCLYCLTRCGRVRYIKRDSLTLQCREHSYLYRSWRRARGLPPLKRPGNGENRSTASANKGRETRASIREMLAEGKKRTAEVAGQLGYTRDGALYQLKRMETAGEVRRDNASWGYAWELVE